MDPAPPRKKKPKPIVALVAVIVPLLAIAAAAIITTSGDGDPSATATTISQDGDPEAQGTGTGTGGDAGTGSKDEGKGSSTSTTKPKQGVSTKDVPSTPQNTGAEAERATVTYPQPTVPASGCSRRSGTVVITLGSTPNPPCLKLQADQPIVVRNRTGKEISFVAISVNEVVAAGTEVRIGTAGKAFGDGRSTFWSPGNPQLSGIVIVG